MCYRFDLFYYDYYTVFGTNRLYSIQYKAKQYWTLLFTRDSIAFTVQRSEAFTQQSALTEHDVRWVLLWLLNLPSPPFSSAYCQQSIGRRCDTWCYQWEREADEQLKLPSFVVSVWALCHHHHHQTQAREMASFVDEGPHPCAVHHRYGVDACPVASICYRDNEGGCKLLPRCFILKALIFHQPTLFGCLTLSRSNRLVRLLSRRRCV
jgi:hypothetical protein